MSASKHYRLAADMGGTFIDFVLLDQQTGEVRLEKMPSLAEQLPAQFVKGIQSFEVPSEDVRQIFHGMTVGVNALLQEKGAKVGLITTQGFRDVLEMGRGGRKPVYDFVKGAPVPLIERSLRREVAERMSVGGEVLQALDLEQLDIEVDYLVSKGVTAIAVALLHSYANPSHEALVKQRIATRYPQLPVSVSHEIASVWREYERTSTTVLNAFIQPVVKAYLDAVTVDLAAAGYRRPLAIMQSSGGVADVRNSADKPIRSIMSGPAGGVLGAAFLCKRLGYQNVICTDVGGTSYDVAIIENGRVLERTETEIAGRPIVGSLIDVISIGAGGGSVAWLDHRNALQVGPRSAGASPGPVCFGRGGTEPTVTDAHLILSSLDPDYFLGGRMRLDLPAARRAIEEHVAKPLGLDAIAAARGIVAIAENNMANAIRTKTVARGIDPREFVMLAYGGGGGLFACSVAQELGVSRVIVPIAPANFSAWGILTSDYVEDVARTRVMPFSVQHIHAALETLAELRAQATAAVASYGFQPDAIEGVQRFDLRFKGQEYTVTVDLDPQWNDAAAILEGARRSFVAAHRRLYGHGDPAADLELVSIRCRAIGAVKQPELPRAPHHSAASPARARSIFFGKSGGAVATPVFQRDTLGCGAAVTGPAIIDEWTTTTVIPPGWQALVDDFGNLIVHHVAG